MDRASDGITGGGLLANTMWTALGRAIYDLDPSEGLPPIAGLRVRPCKGALRDAHVVWAQQGSNRDQIVCTLKVFFTKQTKVEIDWLGEEAILGNHDVLRPAGQEASGAHATLSGRTLSLSVYHDDIRKRTGVPLARSSPWFSELAEVVGHLDARSSVSLMGVGVSQLHDPVRGARLGLRGDRPEALLRAMRYPLCWPDRTPFDPDQSGGICLPDGVRWRRSATEIADHLPGEVRFYWGYLGTKFNGYC